MRTLTHVRSLALAACCAAALVTGACGDDNPAGPSPGTGGGGGGGGTTPTLSTIQTQIFSARCTGCHGGSSPAAGMNLTAGNSHAALVNVNSVQKSGAIRVVPSDPDNSYLIKKLRGDSDIVGERMPRGGPYLSDDQINLVRQWIAAGAPNN